MQVARVLAACCWLLSASAVSDEAAARRVLEVKPLSEAVRTDAGGDLGFSAVGDDAARVPVKRLWGVSDATARAGRLFLHTIDKNAFQGPIRHFKVSGRSADAPLPSWLTFDQSRRTFSGVPLRAELGPHLVTVRALAQNAASTASDRFMVDVIHEPDADLSDPRLSADEQGAELNCADGSAATVASVYFDVAPQLLDGAARLRLLYAVAHRARVPADAIHVTSHAGMVPLSEQGVLEAGPGLAERTSPRLTVASWKVGCAEQVRPERQEGLQAIQQDRRLSTLSAAAGQTAVAWLLRAVEPAGRQRRQADEDGSGDYYYDDDDGWEDYDGTLDEWDQDYDEEPELPVSRVVPALASPSQDAPPASPVYPPPRVTATDRYGRTSTAIPVPVVPVRYTPDLSLQPSRTLGETSSSPGRVTPDLESSMRVSVPPEATVRWTDEISSTPTLVDPRVWETAAVGSSNYPPHRQRRMRQVLVIAGKELRYRIPEDTFYDQDSGDTRSLHLMLHHNSGAPLMNTDWLQFDAFNQEIYGLPKGDDIGKYKFRLTAQDDSGAGVTEKVEVVVRQSQHWRSFNHRFNLRVKLLKPRQFPVTVDWQLLLLRKLAAMQGEEGTGSLLAYDMRVIQDQPLRLTWVNDSLSTHSCDTRELSRIAARLLGKDVRPSAELRKVLSPEFAPISVRVDLINVCQNEELSAVPQQTVTTEPEPDQPPIRRKHFDLIEAQVGRLLRLQVPEDTFFDMQDGGVRSMELELLTADRQPVAADNWLRFEPRNQEFVGLPLDDDVGRTHYHLVCTDSGKNKVSDSFEVRVEGRPADAPDPTVQLSVTLDNDYDQFSGDPLQKARFMEKLAALFGDDSTGAILVHDIRNGSVVFSWYNSSLPTDRCPDQAIEKLRRRLLDESEAVTPEAVQALGPDFRLTAAEVMPRGLCLADRTPTVPPRQRAEQDPPEDEEAPESKGDEYLVTFIIPAVVIAAMLLIAGVIACVLYRARRRGKMAMTDNGTYVSRGIPVIFSDELEDRMEKNAKTPVILTNEQPPEPPTYPASTDGASSPATPMLNARGEPAGEDAPYERPPPFAGVSEGRGGRAKPVPNYRQPPPYVPP